MEKTFSSSPVSIYLSDAQLDRVKGIGSRHNISLDALIGYGVDAALDEWEQRGQVAPAPVAADFSPSRFGEAFKS
jgi:hypothetical protein